MTGVFVTGATGLLGRYLLRDLLLNGHEVAVLARRGPQGADGRQRIDDALRHFEHQLGRTLPRPLVFEGSLHEFGLGLSAADRTWFRIQPRRVLHCGASIQFQRDPRDDEPYRSNVTGTKNLLDLCESEEVAEFHHVSTAYVCGDRPGPILEDEFDCGQAFRNDYEVSKNLAEQMLRSASFLRSRTIYRPSIIVGDSQTAYTSTFHGFYLPVQLVHAASSSGFLPLEGRGYMQAIGLSGNERKNLVPVDWVSAVLVRIFEQPQHHGRTYHLTNTRPVTTGELEFAISEAIRQSVTSRKSVSNIAPPTAAQLAEFREQMKVYNAYLSDDPDFDVRQTRQAVPDCECPQLDHSSLVKLARFAIDANFGWPRQRPQPAVLDVASSLERLTSNETPPNAADLRLRLEVSGSCGGAWQVAFKSGKPIAVTPHPADPAQLSAYLNVYTLRKILAGQRTVRSALQSGTLVLEGAKKEISHGPELLVALFRQLPQSKWDGPGGLTD